MLVGVIIQAVEQGHSAFSRQYRLAACQRRQGTQKLVVTRAEQVRQFEAEQRLASPLAALNQQPFFVVDQQHPTRWMVVGEQTAAQCIFPVAVDVTAFALAIGGLRFELQRAELFVIGLGNSRGDHQQRLVLGVSINGQH
ncbi:hypothetical protein LD001_01590, partial [Pseudomonas kurunegalensis]|uniref:hypothetical protein n=1 Tax=Pseudomonas kurunegalensis TaxID=485880 RepID=UPI001CDC352A